MKVYISKADCTIDVNWDEMPENAKAFIIEYGLKQKLNDAGSSATVKDLGKDKAGEQAKAMAEVVLASLMEGKVTVRQAAVTLTQEEREFNKLVKSYYKKLIGKPGDDFDYEVALEEIAIKLDKTLEDTQAAIQAKAKKAVEVAKAVAALKADLPTVDIDL